MREWRMIAPPVFETCASIYMGECQPGDEILTLENGVGLKSKKPPSCLPVWFMKIDGNQGLVSISCQCLFTVFICYLSISKRKPKNSDNLRREIFWVYLLY
jgi:hypothetical protein